MFFDRYLQIATDFDCDTGVSGNKGVVGDVIPTTQIAGGTDIRSLGAGNEFRFHFQFTEAMTRSGVGDLTFAVVLADNTLLTSNVWVMAQSPPWMSGVFDASFAAVPPSLNFQFEIIVPMDISLGQAVFNRKYMGIYFYNYAHIALGAGNEVDTGKVTVRGCLTSADYGKAYPASTDT